MVFYAQSTSAVISQRETETDREKPTNGQTDGDLGTISIIIPSASGPFCSDLLGFVYCACLGQ